MVMRGNSSKNIVPTIVSHIPLDEGDESMKEWPLQLLIGRLLTVGLCSLLIWFFSPVIANAQNSHLETNLEEVETIAKEATIWAFPMVENYRSMYLLSIDSEDPNYVGPINQINNVRGVYTPDDTAFVTPNSDTPYSHLVMDLRAEPLVVTMPDLGEDDRYYSAQLIDLYTFNFDYLGSRNYGNHGGNYMIAGPNWHGQKPNRIDEVIHSETNLAYALLRTQLKDPDDEVNVTAIQDGYKVQPLHEFLSPETASPVSTPDELKTHHIHRQIWENQDEFFEHYFFKYVNFLLQFCPPPYNDDHPYNETQKRHRFATIGVTQGEEFPPQGVSQQWLHAIDKGFMHGIKEIDDRTKKIDDRTGEQDAKSFELFGSREELSENNNGVLDDIYLNHAMGARVGIYGNSLEEAYYYGYKLLDDSTLDGSMNNYILTIKDEEVSNDAFWSVSLYDGQTRYLVENEIDRYLINSSMDLQHDEENNITNIYVQNRKPGNNNEELKNWLPAPCGPLYLILRIYLPKEELQDRIIKGKWEPPTLEVNNTSEDPFCHT